MFRAMQYRMFWYNFWVLINDGVPVLRALNTIIHQTGGEDKFNSGIKKIAQDIENNNLTLSEAMKISKLFSEAEINLINIGETTNTLCEVCSLLVKGNIPTRADQYQQFYRILGILLQSGVPILAALRASSLNLDQPLQDAVMMMINNIVHGDILATPMEQSGEFSIFEVKMISIAEQVGTLNATLLQLAEVCEKFVIPVH